jgi:glycosyltransferase involved in cell wall biosynthesis
VLSIITPFYNTGDVFHETARSVFVQSMQAWEWIVVNDGSTDAHALEVLAHYRRRARVEVIDLPARGGPAAARNAGASRARTEYLLLLDSDDLIEPTAAEKWWWFLQSYQEYAFVKGFSVGFGEMQYQATSGFHDEAAFLERNRVDITSLIRKRVAQAVDGFPPANRDGLEDWEFWLRCAAAGEWGSTVPEYLSWYRRRGDDAARWPNWQGDGGSPALRERMRRDFATLYERPERFPTPRPPQLVARAVDDVPAVNRLAKESRRILLVVPWLTVGGSDAFNLDLVRHLSGAGWEVTIVSALQGDQAWRAAFTAVTPDVFTLPDFLRLSDYPRFIRYVIQSRDVDVVMLTNSEMGYRLLPYLRRHCAGVAFVDFCHMEEDDWQDGGYPRMSIEAAPWLDRSIVLSAHLRQWMIGRGRQASDVVVSHNGVTIPPTQQVTSARGRLRQEWAVADQPVILFAGRVVEQKQPDVFAEAVIEVARGGVPFTMVIAGDGPLLPAVLARLDSTGLTPRLRVLGEVSRERLGDVLCASDVLCLPSRWEGISLVVQEAMARGVAVVTADVGGQRELVTADCGILIAPGPLATLSRAYAEALRFLLADAAARQAMGERARARVSAHFRVDQMGARMEGLLLETLESRSMRERQPEREESAEGVVADLQASYLPHWRWVAMVVAGSTSQPATLNARAFRSLTILEPAYRWGLRRGWAWLPALRRRMRGPIRQLLGLDR